MKTIQLNLYSYEELSDKAKERALDDFNKDNDDPFMQSHMINLLQEELEERGVKYDSDALDVRYSLAHCQGDGFMFIGVFDWQGCKVRIKHGDRHYCHMYTASIEYWHNADGSEHDYSDQEKESFFEMYFEVCKHMERIGYEHIEWMQSAEHFQETCDANEFTFEEDGKMRNV